MSRQWNAFKLVIESGEHSFEYRFIFQINLIENNRKTGAKQGESRSIQ